MYSYKKQSVIPLLLNFLSNACKPSRWLFLSLLTCLSHWSRFHGSILACIWFRYFCSTVYLHVHDVWCSMSQFPYTGTCDCYILSRVGGTFLNLHYLNTLIRINPIQMYRSLVESTLLSFLYFCFFLTYSSLLNVAESLSEFRAALRRSVSCYSGIEPGSSFHGQHASVSWSSKVVSRSFYKYDRKYCSLHSRSVWVRV